MRKLSVSVLLSVLICMTSSVASARCLQVDLDESLGISIGCWEIYGEYQDVSFEFTKDVGGSTGGLYWKLKTFDPATDCVCPPAPVARTGLKHSYATGGDGNIQMGVPWPVPRFTDNGDGTVTDNLTGLIWLKNADCMQFWFLDVTGQNNRTWNDALAAANALANGYCGLSDGSGTGQWRLPNRNELLSLVDIAYYDPALCNSAGTAKWSENNPFTGVQPKYYWSSTTHAADADQAWFVFIRSGNVDNAGKASNNYVWCVRGGH